MAMVNYSGNNTTTDDYSNITSYYNFSTVDLYNCTATEEYSYPRRAVYEIVLCALFLFAILLTAFLGNLAVIMAVMSSTRLRDQPANLFIINLAVGDMAMAAIVMFSSFVSLCTDGNHVNFYLCNFICATNYCLIIVSMLTLAFISGDRYIAIKHALSYSTHATKKRINIMIGYSWFQGIAFAIPPMIVNWVHYDYWEVVCAIDWHYEKQQAVYYVISAFILCFGLPGAIMLFNYLSIIKEAGKTKITDAGQASSASKKARKTIQSLLIVVMLFFVCLTPFSVTKLLKVIFSDPSIVHPYANLSASFFGYMSSVVNPFIYGIFRSDFRSAYKRLLLRIPLFQNLALTHTTDEYSGSDSQVPGTRLKNFVN